MLTIIRDKSNMERVFERVLFIFCRKQVSASALITSDPNFIGSRNNLEFLLSIDTNY
jgi:hypothetical protein